MRREDNYFEKERMDYILSVFRGNNCDSYLHLGRMQGYTYSLFICGVDMTTLWNLHMRIDTAIDFAYRMRRKKLSKGW